ncbi:MAG: RagB/SusD family nutrient uptake outer membrane protein, partial [Mucilaginibacter sp.]
LLAALMIPLGCKKSFLTQTNTFAGTEEATFQTSDAVIGIVNSVYDTYQNSDFLKKSIWYYANFITHDWYNNGNDVAWNNYTIPATFYAIPTFWNYSFIGINRANQALAVIEHAKAKGVVTADLAARLSGECYFLRGSLYYYLGGTFGGVPLEVGAVPDPLSPRASQDAVFQQVIADMKQAETLCWSKTQIRGEAGMPNLGRATKGAAYAYEGSAQMWLGKYTDALTAFNNTELTSNYHLLPNFFDLQEFNNQNNDESLFEVQFDLIPGGSQSWGGSWQVPGGEIAWIDSFSWPNEITGEGYDYGSPSLYYSYQAGDTRKLATIIGPGDKNLSPGIIAQWGGIKGYPFVTGGFAAFQADAASTNGGLLNKDIYTDGAGNIINTNGTAAHPWYGLDATPRSGFVNEKHWRDPTLTGNSGPSNIFGSQDQVMMRYAEVLLSRAECKIRTGDVAGGLADINTVRTRAFGGTPPAVWIDGLDPAGNPRAPQTDPMQMVLSEYRHELSADYSVMYLLRRAGKDGTGKLYDAQFIHDVNHVPGAPADNNSNPSFYTYGPTSNPALIRGKGVTYNDMPVGHDLLPIPTAAIALNPNLKQNPNF